MCVCVRVRPYVLYMSLSHFTCHFILILCSSNRHRSEPNRNNERHSAINDQVRTKRKQFCYWLTWDVNRILNNNLLLVERTENEILWCSVAILLLFFFYLGDNKGPLQWTLSLAFWKALRMERTFGIEMNRINEKKREEATKQYERVDKVS